LDKASKTIATVLSLVAVLAGDSAVVRAEAAAALTMLAR
jgi:hypothetical protein